MILALARRTGAIVLLGGVMVGLHLAGSTLGPFAPADAVATAADDPLLVATNAARILAMVLCLWLAAVTAIDALALTLRLNPLQRWAMRLAPAVWRTMVLRPIAAATLVLPPVALPVMSAVPAVAAPAADTDAGADLAPEPEPELEMVVYRADAPTLTMSIHHREHFETPANSTHTVGPGENLWSIASAHLAEALGRQPTSTEVSSYWGEVIDANRAHLPDPANPDLIYRGIELNMPLVRVS